MVNALDELSLSLGEGEVKALVGPDGAGKTTCLRIIAGLMSCDSGEIHVPGWETGMEISYMPQKFGLYEDLTVQENMDLYADLRGVPKRERESRYQELLDMCAMNAFRGRLAGKLSGGMKQKLGLVCTLIKSPRLLLLDEPTVGVDPLSRKELWEIIKKLSSSTNMAVLMSTSYMDEAERCDEVILLMDGKVLANGKPEEIRRKSQGMGYVADPVKGDSARALQARLFSLPGVIDAIPHSGSVRFVHGELEAEEKEMEMMEVALRGASVRPVASTLEDSFMLLLREYKREQGEAVVSFSHGEEEESTQEKTTLSEVPVIETKGVYRYFGDFIAVNNVSFSVRRGEVFGLLGPNGAGKTTTFRMLCGLLPASSGTLMVAGVDVRKTREKARKALGYVSQKFSLYGTLTVEENLDFFAGAYGLRGKQKSERIAEIVKEFALEGVLDVPSAELPGGYKQRLALAAGLIHRPSILFLDEPTSGADPLARREFWQRISLLASKGVTIIVTTHFMEEAEYCDKVIIQSDGVALALGSPSEIRTQGGEMYENMEEAFIAIVEKGRRER